jgi:hypothetical protein
MKRWAVIAALAAALSSPALADDQSHAPYAPRLNSIMIGIQLGHFKLWYAGIVRNWDLANYELTLIKTAFEDGKKYYPNLPMADMSTLTQPADELGDAIKAKDGAKFTKAFERLTAECNTCHQAAGLGFIVIRTPRLSPIETSPLSDEAFSPK